MAVRPAVSVTEAMNLARAALETVRVRVVGEISELSDKAGYKAAYFTVCDSGASMPCLMWRDEYAASGITLRCGMLVEVEGKFSAYAAKGRMQFVVRVLTLAGEGQLRLQVAQLARKLENEGLMRVERKRSLPPVPSRIAVVTSPRGKAIHDVLRTLARRYPLAEVLVAGVPVEGADAPERIVEGIEAAARAAPDVVLLVRGGGSYEDLMPFNSEQVARAVAECPVPVVTGIGHEPDTSIADMVADLRASTPTAAAESVAPSVDELEAMLGRERRMLARALAHRVETATGRLRRMVDRALFREPHAMLGPASQAIDLVGASLHRALPLRLLRDGERLGAATTRLRTAASRVVQPSQSALQLAASRLDDLSPLSILARGYAVSYAGDGATIIRDTSQVTIGDEILVRLARGRMGCRVETVQED